MSLSMNVPGMTKAIAIFKSFSSKINKATEEGIRKATLHLHGEVKQSIAGRRAEHRSVDTGRFFNSVEFIVNKDNGMVFSDVEYALFLEFGTSRFVGRRHFHNTVDREKTKVVNFLAVEIKGV